MKNIYLSNPGIIFGYSIDQGEYGKRRETKKLVDDELIDYLSLNIDKKRKTNLYIDSSVSEYLFKNIEKVFSNTKVKVTLETKFFK